MPDVGVKAVEVARMAEVERRVEVMNFILNLNLNLIVRQEAKVNMLEAKENPKEETGKKRWKGLRCC